jgi:glucose/arabinose dehydrogenase
MTPPAARLLRYLVFGAISFAIIATPGCNSQSDRTSERQSGQASNSCQLVESGSGPTGNDPVHLETVVNGLDTPWDLDFLPGGDMLVTERPGRLRLIQNGALVPDSVLEVSVVQSGEGGLLGLALHPDFVNNSLFYLYETAVTDNGTSSGTGNGSVNRVVRYKLSSDHRSAALDRIILDNIQAGNVHNGGKIHFGPDGMLYISTGNAGNTDLSQDPNSLNGKLLRLTPDGEIPGDNPQPGKAWYLNGIRNSEGFDWINSSTLVVADHGPTGEYQGRLGGDEISIAHAGDNLGWPTIWHCETQQGLVTPILSWINAVPPGGLTIYRGNQIPGWSGNVILGTLGSEHLHRIVLDENQNVSKHEVYFEGQIGRIRDVITGPDGELYITTSNCDGRGSCPGSGDAILKVLPGPDANAGTRAGNRRTASDSSPIFVNGSLSYGSGARAPQKDIALQFTVSGTHLFDSAENSCPGDPHMQGVSSTSSTTGNQGEFAAEILLSEMTSRVNASCTLQKNLTDLDSLTVEAVTDADTDACTQYCQSTSNSTGASCESQCQTGQRKLKASKVFSHADLLQLNAASTGQNAAILNVPLTLNQLGPPLSTLHGPDLVVDGKAAQATAQISVENFAADDCAVVEGCVVGPGQHKLLRFDGVIQNLGDSDFVLGSPEKNPLFVYSSCHEHYHLSDIMLYELLDPVTKKPVLVNGSAVVGRKQGFCMIDNDQIAGNSDGKYDCDLQGITPGWSDTYDHTLDCQWLDVTGVPPGIYTLRITVNPIGKYTESNTSNNSSETTVTIQ